MNRKSIRDHRRKAKRFRFTIYGGRGVGEDAPLGTTTWPMTKKDPDGKQAYNRYVHTAAIVQRVKRNIRRLVLVTKGKTVGGSAGV